MSTQQHPAAWAVFADNGNVRLWSTDHAEARAFAEGFGQPLIALYPGPPAQPAPHDDPIGNACRLLREAAQEYAEGVSVNGVPDWKNEPDTHSAYIEHITAAHRLEQWAASIGAGGVEPLRRRECLRQIAELAQAAPAAGNWINAADVDRLVRELDVALNGEEGAAPQASLCDVVGQAKAEAAKLGRPLLAAPAAVAVPKAQEAEAVAEVTCNRPDNYSSNHRIRWLSQETYPVGTKLYTSAPVPAAVAGPSYPSITLDFKQATELLEMFGGEPGLVTLQMGCEKSHSGTGLYAYYSELPEEGAEFLGAEPDDEAAPTTQPAPVAQGDAAQPRLAVRLTSYPESNGKRNWAAMLVRAEKFAGLLGNVGGITIAHGELWNRVAYAAECARFLIGERDTEPCIFDYGNDIQTPDEWQGETRRAARAQTKEGGA